MIEGARTRERLQLSLCVSVDSFGDLPQTNSFRRSNWLVPLITCGMTFSYSSKGFLIGICYKLNKYEDIIASTHLKSFNVFLIATILVTFFSAQSLGPYHTRFTRDYGNNIGNILVILVEHKPQMFTNTRQYFRQHKCLDICLNWQIECQTFAICQSW